MYLRAIDLQLLNRSSDSAVIDAAFVWILKRNFILLVGQGAVTLSHAPLHALEPLRRPLEIACNSDDQFLLFVNLYMLNILALYVYKGVAAKSENFRIKNLQLCVMLQLP